MGRKALSEEERQARRREHYEKAKAKRRDLAAERRKVRKRTTTAKMPKPAHIKEAWERRDESIEAMILFGGLLHDLECYVDNSLVMNEGGEIVSRHAGIHGWLIENLPSLASRYKAMMNYKSIVKKIRQIMKIFDPVPTEEFLIYGKLRPLLDEFEVEESKHPEYGRHKNINAVLARRLKRLQDFLDK